MKTSLLIRLTSIGKTGFQVFKVTSFTMLKLMVFVVMILARRIRLGAMGVSWFGGSSILMSWHVHFSILETRSETSMISLGPGGLTESEMLSRWLGRRCENKRK